MNFRVLFLCPLLSFSIISCSSSKKAEAPSSASVKTFYSKEISIDGSDKDWQNISLLESPSKTFEYGLAHNEDYVYLLMKITNPLEQTKFMYGGMELWIDPTGEKKTKIRNCLPCQRRNCARFHAIWK